MNDGRREERKFDAEESGEEEKSNGRLFKGISVR